VFDYANEQAAAAGMLGEAAGLLLEQNVKFAVIGGWLPFLFNQGAIGHPGTFDVDVLLHESTPKESFELAASRMLLAGYLRAPKNQFQLHRILQVRGECFVYHVDFLHRRYADDSDELIRNWGRFQSIAGPGTDIIFTADEHRLEPFQAILPSGKRANLAVPFCTEVGFLSAKGRSASAPKRTRDAFDVYLVVRQSRDYGRLVARSEQLLKDPIFRLSLEMLRDGFKNRLLGQAVAHLRDVGASGSRLADEVKETMDAFFHAVFNNPA